LLNKKNKREKGNLHKCRNQAETPKTEPGNTKLKRKGLKQKRERGMGVERSELVKLLKQKTKKKRKKKELTCRNHDEKQAENGAGKH
jgi:hypothetical protein